MSETTNRSIPAVSVVVPAYNAEKTLEETLSSIDKQTLQELEIIVVDDGSKDESLRIAQAFATHCKHPITVLHQENKGPSAARNLGLNNAQGEYFAFVDADDVVDERMYEKMYSSAKKHDADIVSCGRRLVDAATGEEIRRKVPGYECLRGGIRENPEIITRVGQLMCDKIFRRSIAEEHHIRLDEDLRHAEDFLFISEIKLYVRNVSSLKEPLYDYRVNNSTSLSGGNENVMDIPIACEKVISIYKKNDVFEITSLQLLFIITGYYLRKCRDLDSRTNQFRQFKGMYMRLFNIYFSKTWRKMVFIRSIKMIAKKEASPMLLVKVLS